MNVTFLYKNHRGEVRRRVAIPRKLWYGSTQYHPEKQWLLTAFDVEKDEVRTFAMKDISQWESVR